MADVHRVCDVHVSGHFVYTGGTHGDSYADYRSLAQFDKRSLLHEVCIHLVQRVIKNSMIDSSKSITIVGPETLGAKMLDCIFCTFGDELPYQISTRAFKRVSDKRKYVWTSSATRPVDAGSQVIWVDDLLNKGSTFKITNKLIRQCGSRVMVVGVIGNRSGLKPDELGVDHIEALERFILNRYDADSCPLCRDEVPIVRHPGHGHKFEEVNPGYPGGFVDLF